MGSTAFIPVIGDILSIVSEAVVDKDKRNEINLKLAELSHAFQMAMIQSQTVPWVDALVKVMYALVALAAPLGTAATTAFGLLMHYLVLTGKVDPAAAPDTMTHLLIDSAFPAWRAARHVEKVKGVAIPAEPEKATRVRSGPPR